MYKKLNSLSSGRLAVGLINIRSIRFKVDAINEFISEFNVSLLCVTETWMRDSDVAVVEAALPANYSILHCPRPPNIRLRGGGVAIIHSNALSSIRVVTTEILQNTFECICVRFCHSGKSMKVAVIYRAGHAGTDIAFMTEFGLFLETFFIDSDFAFVCGDFNYWMDDPGSKPFSSEFINLLNANNCANLVTEATHIAGHTLDLVISSRRSLVEMSDFLICPVDSAVSDHSFVKFNVNFPEVVSEQILISYRNYKKINIRQMMDVVANAVVNLDISRSCEELVTELNDLFSSLSDRYCPIVQKKILIRPNAPWFNSAIRSLRSKRRAAERKWRRLRTPETRNDYVTARRAVVCEVSSERVGFYRSKISSCNGDHRKLWGVLNGLLGRVSVPVFPTSPSETHLAEKFNDFFVNKIKTIRENIDAMPYNYVFSDVYKNFTPIYGTDTFNRFSPVSSVETLNLIKNVNKTYCSLDKLNVSKALECYEAASPFISAIINKSFSEGFFPQSEKRAVVRPLLKKVGLDTQILNNYRPVSNLSFLSKVLEKAILDQILPFFERNGILPRLQSAFRKYHSTETALCKIHDDLILNICNGSPSILVLLDLSAAFDTIDHDLLIRDLSSFGVSGDALSLIKSYIFDRHQAVCINSASSNFNSLTYGVPQGSILGPILFLVYACGLSNVIQAHGVDYHIYADDTQIYMPIENIENCRDRISMLLSDLRLWMQNRKLKLNEGKTDVILVKGSMRRDISNDFNFLTFGKSNVLFSEEVKNIGVIFDRSLSFDKHIGEIVRTCNWHIRNLYSIKKFLDRNSLLTLVHALISCRIDYCNSIFVGLPKVQLRKLQVIQNSAARLICSVHPRDRITPSLISLHWLPIKARIEYKICLIVFKVLKFGQPGYLLQLLTPYSNSSTLDLRSSEDPHRLFEPIAGQGHNFSSRSFSFVAPRLYNLIPLWMKNITSVATFKKYLKTHFFRKAYNTECQSITSAYAV